MTDTEREDLEALIESPGWQRFVAHAAQEWDQKLSGHLRIAVDHVDDALALSKIRQVIVAKDAVERLLAWPGERVRSLRGSPRTSLSDLSGPRLGT